LSSEKNLRTLKDNSQMNQGHVITFRLIYIARMCSLCHEL
jgi:hypothetical protein